MPKLPSNFSVKKAHDTQRRLSKLVIHNDQLPQQICTVGGVDVSYVGELGVGAVAVLDFGTLEILETSIAVCPARIPYVPTLLSFRELPPAIAAIRRLRVQPDVFLVDAQGWAHPYRCGFASHLGLALDKPTVGAAKSRLIGQPTQRGGRTLLLDRGEVIGEEVVTRVGVKPVYVSVGHKVSLQTAVELVRRCSKTRIPEPLRQAHKLATQARLALAEKAK
ncbi:MAG: endonuclease V [Candidatus Bathyarchaeota archaeon]|nr:endonuclease V [Candidatus Bathyarchaeota archaeon]